MTKGKAIFLGIICSLVAATVVMHVLYAIVDAVAETRPALKGSVTYANITGAAITFLWVCTWVVIIKFFLKKVKVEPKAEND